MKWHLETRKISSLKDHPKNPRVLTKEQAYCDIIVNRWVKYMQKNNKPFTIKKNGEVIQWQDQRSQ